MISVIKFSQMNQSSGQAHVRTTEFDIQKKGAQHTKFSRYSFSHVNILQ